MTIENLQTTTLSKCTDLSGGCKARQPLYGFSSQIQQQLFPRPCSTLKSMTFGQLACWSILCLLSPQEPINKCAQRGTGAADFKFTALKASERVKVVG